MPEEFPALFKFRSRIDSFAFTFVLSVEYIELALGDRGVEYVQFKRKFHAYERYQFMSNFFMAIRPTSSASIAARTIGRQLKIEHALPGLLLKPENLHVTMFSLFSSDIYREDLIERAEQFAKTIHAAPFEARFDVARTFVVRDQKLLVLSGSNLVDIFNLQKQFGSNFKSVFVKGAQRNPHITLMYGYKAIREQIIEPVSWWVNEFVLIESSKGIHKILKQWPLEPNLSDAADPYQTTLDL